MPTTNKVATDNNGHVGVIMSVKKINIYSFTFQRTGKGVK